MKVSRLNLKIFSVYLISKYLKDNRAQTADDKKWMRKDRIKIVTQSPTS